ncbi:hypothetical protein RRG08_040828 [Elysia crispata]|uniref:Uncharacterized protein n=1 Tax=Elysia crispata TaxID=231223 RepID=A0AAE0Z957_9GAST|nr:hypothetical protein RRG08_040828 [Elysia crispata]
MLNKTVSYHQDGVLCHLLTPKTSVCYHQMVFSVTCSRQRHQSVFTIWYLVPRDHAEKNSQLTPEWYLVPRGHAKDLSLLSPDGV